MNVPLRHVSIFFYSTAQPMKAKMCVLYKYTSPYTMHTEMTTDLNGSFMMLYILYINTMIQWHRIVEEEGTDTSH